MKRPATLKSIIQEVRGLASEAASCDGGCGDKFCKPELYAKSIQLKLSSVYARLGYTFSARNLMETMDDGYHQSDDCLKTYTALYAAEGEEKDRAAALHRLNQITFYKTSYVSRYIKAIADADTRFGRTVPSLEADNEFVPLLAWEIQSVYGQKSEFEKLLEDEDNQSDERRLLLAIFGSNDSHISQYREESRRRHRSGALATLAITLAEAGAYNSADQSVDRIEEPIDHVRAKVTLARMYGVLDAA